MESRRKNRKSESALPTSNRRLNRSSSSASDDSGKFIIDKRGDTTKEALSENAARETTLSAIYRMFQAVKPCHVSPHISVPSTASTELIFVIKKNTLHQSMELFDYKDDETCHHYALFAMPGKIHRSKSESCLLITDEHEKSPRHWQY